MPVNGLPKLNARELKGVNNLLSGITINTEAVVQAVFENIQLFKDKYIAYLPG